MSTRVWRQLAEEVPSLDTPAQTSVVRLALAMWAADVRAPLTPANRQELLDLLAAGLTLADLERLRGPLLEYLELFYRRTDTTGTSDDRLVDVVKRQFRAGDSDAHPHP